MLYEVDLFPSGKEYQMIIPVTYCLQQCLCDLKHLTGVSTVC